MSAKVAIEDLQLAANTIRGLSMDGIQAAKSGHPGLPMGMADVASVLWLRHLNVSSSAPKWENRDRFVLSGGHGSMLIYSLLHLSGYDLSLDDLKSFRQWGSRTPGHPEVFHTDGVETTTGPLGQGCGNAVGMALAEAMLAERFNTGENQPVDHYTYVFCGDGDLMEGLSHEAFSLAGHLGLNKLILFFDSNAITIEGSTDLACSDDVKKRFQSYGWNAFEIDGHDFDAIEKGIRKAQREKNRPTIVITNTKIGKGSPNKEGKASAHGEPLGVDEIVLTKQNLGLPEDQSFYVPDRVREVFAKRQRATKRIATKWTRNFAAYAEANPEKAAEWKAAQAGELPADLEACLPSFEVGSAVATRSASGKVIQSMAAAVPSLIGGSADLAPSTKTLIDDAGSVGAGSFGGKNLHFGIREHAMGSIMNGIALHGGFRVFGATFFVFADYCRPTLRLAALMGLPVIYVFTHDSFYVGEDGPTHQPIEHLASLRCIPGLTVIRPGDPTETGAAWVAAMENTSGPTALMLTRQDLKVIDRNQHPAASELKKGAYVLKQTGEGSPDLILIASGSEVNLALSAADALAGVNVRVVSMPSWELFEAQSADYKERVLPSACGSRIAIEAGHPMGWNTYTGNSGRTITIDHFGASGPYATLEKEFGFTVDNVVAEARSLLGG